MNVQVENVAVGGEQDTVKSVSQREGNQTLLLQMKSKDEKSESNFGKESHG